MRVRVYSTSASRFRRIQNSSFVMQAHSFRRYQAKIEGILGRMSTLIVGPGLGDDPGTVKAATQIIK